MLQAVVGVSLEHLQPLGAGDVPISSLLDLREYPRLDERPSADHGPRHRGALSPRPLVIMIGQDVSVEEDRDGPARLGALLDVRPVGRLGVALLAGSPVYLADTTRVTTIVAVFSSTQDTGLKTVSTQFGTKM